MLQGRIVYNRLSDKVLAGPVFTVSVKQKK